MKQTAVEFLEDKLNQIKSSSTDMNGTIKFLETEFKELFQQAKEMEDEQMINYHTHLIEKFTKLEYTFNTDPKLILENYKTTKQ